MKGDVNWEDYWRLLFKKVTEQDITEFENKYKGSEEETSDVKQLYVRYKVMSPSFWLLNSELLQ